MTIAEIKRLQRSINAAGLGPVDVDGRYGSETRKYYAAMLAASDVGGAGVSLPVPAAAKPWWLSEGLLGSLAVVAVGALGLAKWGVDAGSLAELLSATATVVAGVIAARGRARATAPIDNTLVLPGVRARLRKPCELQTNDERNDDEKYWDSDRGPLGGDD